MPDPTRDHLPRSVGIGNPDAPCTIGDGRGDSATGTTAGGSVAGPPGYELFDEIGRGGMGVVYRAHDTKIDRDVAVKLLQGMYTAGSPGARRFVDEARITGQLQHPGIPPVHQVGELPDGRPFLAMKLIRGHTLDAIIKDGSMSRGSLVAVFGQICQAVGYAHSNVVVHRDLKPANVMVGAFGEVQVMDWGLAKRLRGRGDGGESPSHSDHSPENADPDPTIDHPPGSGSDTREGSVLGTPAYMAPEQARGEVEWVDARSDVFGLGAILCAVLTGRPPFASTRLQTALQSAAAGRLDEAFARLDSCGAETELVALCKRCLSPDREARPRDAGEVADAVAKFRAEVEQRARHAELDRVRAEGERAKAEAETREQRKRRKIQLGLLAALMTLATGGVSFAWWQDRLASEQRMRNDRNATRIETLLEQCESALMAASTGRAATPLAEVEQRFAEGGADQFADRLARCRADFDILRELDRIHDLRWVVVAGQFPGSKAVASQWPAAFARFGIVPGTTPLEEAARRISQSLVRDRLMTALDLWLIESRSPDLLGLLRALDADDYRTRVRAATVAWDAARLTELAGQDTAEKQPEHFAIVLGSNFAIPTARRTQILESVADRRPDNFEVLITLVHLTQIGTKRPEGGQEKWIRAALAVRPESVAARNDLGLVLFARGQLPAAIAAFRDAIRADPKLALPYYNLGLALFENKHFDEAIDAFRQGITADPTDVHIRTNLANTLFATGDMDGAIAACKDAIRVDQRAVTAHNIMGMALTNKGQLNEAIAAHRDAIKYDSKHAGAYLHLGIALRMNNDVDGAITAWKDSIKHDPRNAIAHTILGETYFQQTKYPDAIDCFTRAIKADPNYVNAHVLLGEAHRRMGNIPGARAAFTSAARLDKRRELLLWTLPSIDIAPPPREVKRP